MRILHLIDGEQPAREGRDLGLTFAACRAVLERAGGVHEVVLVGGANLQSRARKAGLPDGPRLCPPLGQASLGSRALRRLVVDRAPDVVQTWSQGTLVAARRAAPEVPRACAIVDGATPLRAARHAVRASVVGACGASARQELGGSTRLLPLPALGSAMPARADVRSALEIDEAEVVVAHLGANPHASAMRFVFLLGLLHSSGVSTVGLLSEAAAQVGRGEAFWRGLGSTGRLLAVDDAALGAADLAVWEGGGAGPSHALPDRPAAATLQIVRALSLGIPVVASREAAAELAGGVKLAVNATLPELARVALPLAIDQAARKRAGGGAREYAMVNFSDDKFAAGVARLWAEARR